MSVMRMFLAGAVAFLAAVPAFAQERRDGDARAGADILCVLPITKAPDADVIAALEKVFGKQLKITVDKDLKVAVLQGPDTAVAGAVQGLRDVIDTTPPRLPDGEGERGAGGPSIDVVRLHRAKAEVVAKLVKQYVSDKVQITERPTASALIFEGDRALVEQAASLARQIDGQLVHPSLRRVLLPAGEGDRPREGDRRDPARPRDGERPKPPAEGERPKEGAKK